MTDYIQDILFQNKDEKHQKFEAKLIPNVAAENIIGVKTPILRKLSKELYKNTDIEDFLCDLPHRYLEEYTLHGAIISLCKDYGKTVDYVDKLLPFIDNWATCDMLSPKIFSKNKEALLTDIKRWLSSDRTYTVRFGIEMLMSHYLDGDFKPFYLKLVSVLRSEEYYVNMMIAWFFATALAKQWDSTVIYIKDKKLDIWVHNKTIQKAVESNRITDEQKEYLKSLKIRS
ncbi:MAG: DNA alkylation repair protein [Clostridia bacterium]|nr:DNA alkylation repair protein [Clostridia bacterium]